MSQANPLDDRKRCQVYNRVQTARTQVMRADDMRGTDGKPMWVCTPCWLRMPANRNVRT